MSREANVTHAGLLRERVRRLVEAPVRVVVAERVEHLPPREPLSRGRERAPQHRRVTAVRRDERQEHHLQAVEDTGDVRSRRPLLEVVEQHVVRRLGL